MADDGTHDAGDEPLPACPYCSQWHAAERLKCPETDMPLPLRGRILSNKFQFLRRLGKGGMASVWLALNTAVDREVAIKVIRPEVLKNDDLVARFRSEAKAAGRIGHPNVCEILDFGVGPIGPYIVMESMRGETLAQLIVSRGRIPAAEAVDIVLEALDGLQAAHERGIVHRDLKPENVFLHQPTAGPQVIKLMDFGVAKFTDGSAEITTEHGALLGTPEYMAPEQYKGADQAEARTDVWAVGAILYRALTGRHAFKGPTVAATLMMVTHDDPEPLQAIVPEIPGALSDVVLRCMSKAIEDRYADVGALRDALLATRDEMGVVDDEVEPTPANAEAQLPDDSAAGSASSMERRPTQNYPAASRSMRATPWIGLGALAVLGLAAAIAWWPGEDPKPTIDAVAPTPPPSRHDTPAEVPTALRLDVPDSEPQPLLDDPVLIRDPDVGTARGPSPVPPPPASDAFEDPEAPTPGSAAALPSESFDLSEGVVDLGNGYVISKTRGKRSDHGDARNYCEALGTTGHMGFTGWKLPFPGLVERIKDSGAAPLGQYWTSARWRGNVKTFVLPGGNLREGVGANRRVARALCVSEIERRKAP